ncbi:hypothetical protein EV676_10664 [Caldimonas thermodepolymerans]|uniref:Uncharacterized protein n=1 Tax=Caldimonas thermodepolymerans TaxID=215580 RepID=A0AA46DDG5_9BURK|nr:hypothetical protein EV676_10664 [Caldimonas thermodepolymerans]
MRGAKAYKPLPGSIPARVIEILQALPEGKELSTAELADMIDQPPDTLVQCLQLPRRRGMLQARRSGGRVLLWSLGDGDMLVDEEDDGDGDTLPVPPAVPGSRAYVPRRGSQAWQALKVLRALPPGAELSSVELCERIGVPRSAIATALAMPRRCGLVKVRTRLYRGRQVAFWSLGDAGEQDGDASQSEARPVDRDVFAYALRQQFDGGATVTVEHLNCALLADGCLLLEVDDMRMRLSREQREHLVHSLASVEVRP